jgi:hypothetical protein
MVGKLLLPAWFRHPQASTFTYSIRAAQRGEGKTGGERRGKEEGMGESGMGGRRKRGVLVEGEARCGECEVSV